MPGAPSVLPEEIAGRYAIERELGHGATAVVYLAHDRLADRAVALKVLRSELSESLSAERFLREIRVTQLLSHPNIATVLDFGVADGVFYCALNYLDGGTLRARLEREHQLPLDQVGALATALGAALQHAHARHLIHRDVKPENILFAGDHVCLADFGIARAVETTTEATTSTGVVRGTPAYMSPEQASGDRDYDGRSDLYSLACVLYEAIAGVPAFVGPNAQAVLAQRLVHAPRSVRVYRPLVTAQVDSVLARALAIAPADRYRTAIEFTDALAAALAVSASSDVESVREQSGAVQTRRRNRWILAGGFAAAALIAAVIGPLRGLTPWATLPALDTTRIALLPAQMADADLLFGGFSRWRGVTLVDKLAIDDAMRGHRGALSPRAGARIAASVGAGRFVLAQVDSPSSVYGALYDVRAGEMHHARLPLGSEASAHAAVYAALADSLLLRGAADGGPNSVEAGSRDLVAAQLLSSGRTALNNWDLVVADSFFSRAARADTGSGRANLWLAQVRRWANRPIASWLPVAQAAAAKPATLTPVERLLANALVALGSDAYPSACSAYQSVVDADARSFAGWFGLGDCHGKDDVVIRDRRSPSGWRYRSSYEAALRGYVAAFKLLPSTYRGFQARGFSRLQSLLYVTARQVRGGMIRPGGEYEFYSSPILDADTIVFVPVPIIQFVSASSGITAGQVAAAVAHQRERLQAITSDWARAAPNSPYTKEALAIALELRGDPAAIDSLAAGQRLTTEPLHQLRLAVMRMYAIVKFGAPSEAAGNAPFDASALVSARTLADSLLSAQSRPSVAEAGLLVVVSAITGRCQRTAEYLRAAAPAATDSGGVPQYVATDADVLAAESALGCPTPPGLPSLDLLASRIAAPGVAARVALGREYGLVGRIVRSRFPLDSAWITHLAPIGDYLIEAEHDFLTGNDERARSRLTTMIRRRAGGVPGDLTPDVALPESRLWLALGDSASAEEVVGGSLDAMRNLPALETDEATQNVIIVGSLVRAMALRADLAHANPARARRWSQAVVALWAGADPELQPVVRRMQRVAVR